ncbi:MAG: PD-(D/E)XK nuclease family protein [Cytophagales bacterium]|nr:PD-(D/E)XK nuclease family protein [Cytophagales bacterium]
MKFLEEIADVILNRYKDATAGLTVVFPNRRAGLFLQKYLSAKVDQPIWSPGIVGIEDFIIGFSALKPADKFELIFELYKVFNKLNKSKEQFDGFYYWGNILLQDFDELDKFLVDPELLFKNLAHVKHIENSLDHLQEDQKKLIHDFWHSFGEKLSSHQKGFLTVWDNLLQTYHRLKATLSEKGIGYNGMIYRDVEQKLRTGQINPESEKVIFAGFNALSKCEASIISWFLNEGKGEIYWDADDYYLNDKNQEAGKYLREMKFGDPVFGKSFKDSYGNAFVDPAKKIEVLSLATEVGQAQQASEILDTLKGNLGENTAVVLPNNELLFPLLHALPDKVDKLNITMGYPLAASAIYGFLVSIIDLHVKSEGKSVFHFRSILSILRHPVFSGIKDKEIDEIETSIAQNNTIWISKNRFKGKKRLVELIFSNPGPALAAHLMEILKLLAEIPTDDIQKEFIFQFYTLLNRLNEFIVNNNLSFSKPGFQKLLRQMVLGERLPFEGEPLLGLQVMGILETRNLDFENVIVLSMNETRIPPAPKNVSFIPYSIRKVFGLPIADHQDAMYAYIFYRLVQRAKNIYFIYNSTEATGKSGEISRFVRQLKYETALNIVHKTVSSEITLDDPQDISIVKNEQILERLYQYTSKKNFLKRFTPTALNTYLDCRLKFYFKYVLELYEREDISEDVDSMVFGNILHHVMEQLYAPFDIDDNRIVNKEDVVKLENQADQIIEKEFARQFGAHVHHFKIEGQNVLAREIIKKMVLKVLDFDKQRASFKILGVEADDKKGYTLDSKISINGVSFEVGMKGIIDRIEEKDEVVRIVDYKTGKDDKNFADICSLFSRENKQRNKAVFQTFLYGLLYSDAQKAGSERPVQASLFNIRDLFSADFSPLIQCKKSDVTDIRVYLNEFNNELKALLREIFNRKITFSQTDDDKKCSYCPYAGICNR